MLDQTEGDRNAGTRLGNSVRNLYFTSDHLGSTRALTDDSGSVVEQIDYDSFGNGEGSSYTRYTYTGREFDADTGLYYYRARFYDPQVGRFISEDPIGFRGRDVNFYAYVKNGPLLFRDPIGLQRCDPIVGAIIGAGGGGVIGIIGGAVLGPPVGAAIGGAFGGTVGTFVEPGGGTLLGGGGGAAAGTAAGATAGPVVGGVIGAGIGAYIGYRICSGGEATCDSSPRAVPQPTPNAAPMPPPPAGQPDGEQTCRRLLELCLSNPWQPGWNRGFGPKKDCGACYRQCKNNGGAWSFEKCPIFHN